MFNVYTYVLTIPLYHLEISITLITTLTMQTPKEFLYNLSLIIVKNQYVEAGRARKPCAAGACLRVICGWRRAPTSGGWEE